LEPTPERSEQRRRNGDRRQDQHAKQRVEQPSRATTPWTGEPVLSRYDPPFKPWFLRRNEIWLSLR
jgi:hypothetical protein